MTAPAPAPDPPDEHHLIKRHFGAGRSLGDRAADRFVSVFGAWSYIIWQTVVIVVWMSANAYFLRQLGMHRVPDPYPFILLNLGFSAQASYAAPLILMAQNRQAVRDKDFAAHQFEIIERMDMVLGQNTSITEADKALTERVESLMVMVHAKVCGDEAD